LPLASVALLYVVSGAMWWVIDPEDGLDRVAASEASVGAELATPRSTVG
jgi:hypothetical protein